MFDVKDTDFFDLEDESFDTIVEDDISFRGNIKIKQTFMIRGRISGNIISESDLVVDTNAEVNANISAERVLIRGKVNGDVVGKKLIFVTASGSLNGDISTSKVVLEPGCIFTGKCSMLRSENEK